MYQIYLHKLIEDIKHFVKFFLLGGGGYYVLTKYKIRLFYHFFLLAQTICLGLECSKCIVKFVFKKSRRLKIRDLKTYKSTK